MDKYAFDAGWVHARQRLRGLEELLDPGTIRHLETLGVGEGWHCLDVGAGGGTIVEWLCSRVAQTGFVMATDLDTRFLEPLSMPTLSVRRHDIVADALPEGRFDLVLSRLVLEHITARENALRKMLHALKPGGWLMCEDTDNSSVALVSPADPESCELFLAIERAKDRVMAARGHEYCGRRLYGWFSAIGLDDVQAEGRVPFLYANTAAARWKRLSVEQLSKAMTDACLATTAQIDAYVALLDSPEFVAQGFTVTTAWGRRPRLAGT